MWALPKKTLATFVVALFTSVLVGGLFLPAQTSALDVPKVITATPIFFAEEAVETDQVDCQGGGFSWLFCGIIEGLSAAADFLINFLIVPLLVTSPIDLSNPNSSIFQVWSAMRVIASVLMIIFFLVLVFGQAVGNDYASAYAAKKTLPKLLIALILVNISIYIVAALVDIFNVIGMGIGQLMIAPFADSGNIVFDLSGSGQLVSLTALVGGIWGIAAVTLAGLQLFMLTVLLPLILAIVAVFATLIIRQGIILLLIIVAPIAFALYALPNTEQYFQKWWSLLIKTLMVFPIVVAVLTLSNIMVITVTQANPDGPSKVLASLMAIVLMMIPLFIIPFAFTLAGGLIGTIATKAASLGKTANSRYQGDAKDPNSRLARARSNARDARIRSRGVGIDKRRDIALGKSNGRVGKQLQRTRLGRGLADRSARLMNYGDLEAQRSMLNKQEGDMRELKSNYGPDSSIRALFATKQADGSYKSIINGSKFTRDQHMKARSLYGSNISSTQAALDYELSKTADSTEYKAYKEKIPAFLNGVYQENGAKHGLKYDEGDIAEIMTGVQYKNSGKRIDLKHTKAKKDAVTGEWTMKRNDPSFTKDVSENLGNFKISDQKVDTIDSLENAYMKSIEAQTTGDYSHYIDADKYKAADPNSKAKILKDAQEAARQVEADSIKIASALQAQLSRGGQTGESGDVPVMGGGTGAPGRVNEAIIRYASLVSSRQGPPPGS